MLQYTIKRLIMVIPTFFAISLVVFLVLNIAPGRPGATGGASSAGESTNQEQKESYRIFKEQFNLDKPILLNARFWLEQDTVRENLAVANNLDGNKLAKQRIPASEDLEDFGTYQVRHLIALLDDADPEMQRLAAGQLTQSAKRALLNDRRGDKDYVKVKNNEIYKENSTIGEWYWAKDASPEEISEIKANWKGWFETHRAERFDWGTGDKARIFFLDTRFAKYWNNLAHLDFGVSTVDRRPVLPVVIGKLKYSMTLSILSILIAYGLAVPIGVLSAVRQNTLGDNITTVVLFVMYSLPTFFTGTVLLKLFSEGDPLAWFPTGDFQMMDAGPQTTFEILKDIAWHLVLPLITYTSVSLAALSRYARTGVIDVIRADYIRTARAKGLSEPVVIIKHAVRNGMIPILTLLGGLLPALVAGSVVIEVVFNIPGMGRYIYESINLRDYNAVMAVLLSSSFLALIGILLSDLSYAFADPRISFD